MRKPPELLVMLAPALLVTGLVATFGFAMDPSGPGQATTARTAVTPPPSAGAPAGAPDKASRPKARAKPAASKAAPEARVAPMTLTGPRVVLEPKPEPTFRTVPAASFTIASFNVLGHSHTVPGGNKAGRFAPSHVRTGWAVGSLGGHGIDVVGLQEFQAPQLNQFNGRVGGTWAVWPGMAVGHIGVENSLAWRRDVFTAVEQRTIGIPYFGGRHRQMPYVLLEHLATGQRMWVANFHNPATTPSHGNNVRWRRAATGIQIGLANQLAATGHPVFFTGDFNERAEYFCPLTANTALKAANGGSTGSACAPPARMLVDWVFGSDEVTFSNYRVDLSPHIRRTTDHPLVVSEATLPSYKVRIDRD